MAAAIKFVVLATLSVFALIAQTQEKPAFEAASIKPALAGSAVGGYQFGPGNRFVATNFTLKNLIMVAWHVQDFKIADGPGWLDSERFNVEAAASGHPTDDEFRRMLQSLLMDRFHLQLRREKRQMQTYSLSVGRGGPKLSAPQEGSCSAPGDPSAPALPAIGAKAVCGIRDRLRRQDNGSALMEVLGTGATMDMLARLLGSTLDGEVANDTSLDGSFDFMLEYAPVNRPISGALPLDTSGPSLFTALQQQLGLQLRSRKSAVEILIVDHAERPSGN